MENNNDKAKKILFGRTDIESKLRNLSNQHLCGGCLEPFQANIPSFFCPKCSLEISLKPPPIDTSMDKNLWQDNPDAETGYEGNKYAKPPFVGDESPYPQNNTSINMQNEKQKVLIEMAQQRYPEMTSEEIIKKFHETSWQFSPMNPPYIYPEWAKSIENYCQQNNITVEELLNQHKYLRTHFRELIDKEFPKSNPDA